MQGNHNFPQWRSGWLIHVQISKTGLIKNNTFTSWSLLLQLELYRLLLATCKDLQRRLDLTVDLTWGESMSRLRLHDEAGYLATCGLVVGQGVENSIQAPGGLRSSHQLTHNNISASM